MKFNTVKSKVLLFLSILTLLGTIFCIVSCDNFLSENLGKTTININLDLSKLIKNSRNDDTQIKGYVLKLFVYDAKNFQEGDKEIEKLPLLTQTSNKVDISGTVKASLEVAIDSTVIFVGKLFTLNDDNTESEKPLYAGKSEVIKIQPKGNKVHLVLSREKAEIGFEIELAETHEHTFSREWSTSATHHWKVATCEHTENVTGFGEHSFVYEVCLKCYYSTIPEGFVLIPAGTFQMGSEQGNSSNKPVHEVTITKDFYMGKYEVTQAEYEQYCSYRGSSPGDGDNYPAYGVSWYDALVYCNKRSIEEGLTPCYSIESSTDPDVWGTVPTSGNSTWDAVVCNWEANGYRLPTEAEWEYAARAGDDTVGALTYSGTSDVNELGDYAWYSSNSNSTTHVVGTKNANAFGLYDMSGNVFEWCWNFSSNSYDTTTEGGNDPIGILSGVYRVGRGGSWEFDSVNCAVSYRYVYGDPSGEGSNHLGFRLVRASSK